MHVFSWDEWNTDHVAKHSVTREEVEYVVRHAQPPFPHEIGADKYVVWGPTHSGRLLEVILVFRSEDEVEYESLDLEDVLALSEDKVTAIYVIHAMDLTPRMKSQYRKRAR